MEKADPPPPCLGVWDSFSGLPLLYKQSTPKSSGGELLHSLIVFTDSVVRKSGHSGKSVSSLWCLGPHLRRLEQLGKWLRCSGAPIRDLFSLEFLTAWCYLLGGSFPRASVLRKPDRSCIFLSYVPLSNWLCPAHSGQPGFKGRGITFYLILGDGKVMLQKSVWDGALIAIFGKYNLSQFSNILPVNIPFWVM